MLDRLFGLNDFGLLSIILMNESLFLAFRLISNLFFLIIFNIDQV